MPVAWEEKKSLFLYFKEIKRSDVFFGADSELPGCAASFYVSEAIKPEVPCQTLPGRLPKAKRPRGALYETFWSQYETFWSQRETRGTQATNQVLTQ